MPHRPSGVPFETMAMLYEFLPLILFLITLFIKDIYAALVVLMITMPLSLAIKFYRTRKLDRMYFWSTVLALVFGGATLYFRDPRFVFWKPTVFYWAIAVACIVSQFYGDRTIVQRFFGMVGELKTNRLTRPEWTRLNLIWTVFFLAIGALNLYVAFNFSIEVWGTFKAIGLFGISFIFIVIQSIWIVSRLGDDAIQTPKDDTP